MGMRSHASSPPWRARRVLVTGGGGFIGSALCRRLSREGADVHAVSRSEPSHLASVAHVWGRDVAEENDLQDLMRLIQPEVIFHLASEVTGSRELDRVLPTFHSNLTSTVTVLVEATKAGCERVVLTGSMEASGTDREDAVPPSPYAAAKWASSEYARMFHALYGCSVVDLRVSMVYGPGQADRTKLVPYVAQCLLNDVEPELASGMRLVDWIYVDDVVEAHLRAATASEAVGKSIDVGSGVAATIRDVVESLVRSVGTRVAPRFGVVSDRPLEQPLLADVEDARRLLGWRATTNLHDGLRRTVEWLRNEQIERVRKDGPTSDSQLGERGRPGD
jgi:UDP-glucose 4-epimerase